MTRVATASGRKSILLALARWLIWTEAGDGKRRRPSEGAEMTRLGRDRKRRRQPGAALSVLAYSREELVIQGRHWAGTQK